MRTWITIAGMLGWSACLAVACGGAGGLGAPCETNDDCQGELVCDEHDGQSSCQEPHDHGEDAGSETGAASSSDTGQAHDTAAETGQDAGSETSGSSTGHAHDTGNTTTGGGATGDCEAFCGCMTAHCSQYEAYPYADEAACMDACAALLPATLTCFAGFCTDAELEPSPGLAEHWCEHAWGELGTDEC